MKPLLEVKNLSVEFDTSKGPAPALRNVSFELYPGEALGFVGESGSGKSVTSLALFDLLPANARITSGEILFDGKDVLKMTSAEKRKLRGESLAMIFQDPMSSLNPCYTVEDQIVEALQLHKNISKAEAREKTLSLLSQVGIPDPASRLKAYPHELSGGMSQRVMIAMAMACEPKVLVADEPTTALDVTIQKQILQLLYKLRKEKGMSVILVSHDLSVIVQNTDRLQVMYAGEIVETGHSKSVIEAPTHPYTEGLLKCLPGLYPDENRSFRLPSIPGLVPHPQNRPPGCQLAPRCSYRQAACDEAAIPLFEKQDGKTRCLFPLRDKRGLS